MGQQNRRYDARLKGELKDKKLTDVRFGFLDQLRNNKTGGVE